MRAGLILPYMLGLDVISFSIIMSLLFSVYWFSTNKKKKLGRRYGIFIFSFDSFSDIVYIFA
jgi:hypothetical protein